MPLLSFSPQCLITRSQVTLESLATSDGDVGQSLVGGRRASLIRCSTAIGSSGSGR